jgi:hypothetical protein
MRVTSSALALTLVLTGSIEQVSTERRYVVGQRDAYAINMKLEGGPTEIDLKMKIVQVVGKAYENGDADVTLTIPEIKMKAAGELVPLPEIPPQTMRLNRFGKRIDGTAGMRLGMISTQFLQYATYFGEKPLRLGQTIEFSDIDAARPGQKVVGKARVEEVRKGVAKIVSDVSFLGEGASTPSKYLVTAHLDVASGKLKKAEGRVTDLPSESGLSFGTLMIRLERTE